MIKVLSKNVADKIAAGEVIERPISIVKELVENSIDAGAASVTVEIKNGGKSYIRVTDDGCGIPVDQVETAFLRHATSKIENSEDLKAIGTLGFRGEALASIAAVTRTELITKVKDSKSGTKLIISGSEVIENSQTGCPDGTTFVIIDLFYNTPARLKFLKSDGAEAGLIIDYMSQIALAYKDLKIKLINNGNVVFNTLGDGNRLNTIIRIYSDIDYKNLVPADHEKNGIKLTGYISSPSLSKKNRSSQIFFVNGRVVNSKVIEKGLTLGYRERLFEGRYPICFLFLELDPETLDVNIHPNKREVRFDNEAMIIDFLEEAITAALSTKNAVPDISNVLNKKDFSYVNTDITEKPFTISDNRKPFVKNESAYEKGSQVDIKEILSTKSQKEEIKLKEQENIKKQIEIYEPILKPFSFNEIRPIGTIFDTYIIAIDSKNFYLIDQHAAQERIFYEKLVGQYDSSEKSKQQLLVPLIIPVSLAQQNSRGSWLIELENMGFTVEEFGQNTYRISEIPMFMELGEAEDFFKTFIDNISTSTDLRNTVVVDKLIMMSCKASIKAHDKISNEEISALLKDLSNCRNPYSCPHGRPTVIKLSEYDIEKMFKRV